jgi:hypothetical protein
MRKYQMKPFLVTGRVVPGASARAAPIMGRPNIGVGGGRTQRQGRRRIAGQRWHSVVEVWLARRDSGGTTALPDNDGGRWWRHRVRDGRLSAVRW